MTYFIAAFIEKKCFFSVNEKDVSLKDKMC